MLTMEDYAKQPREQRMQHLTRTGDELAAAIKGQSDAVLSDDPMPRTGRPRKSYATCATPRKSSEHAWSRSWRWTSNPSSSRLTRTAGPRRQYLANDAGGALAAFRH